MNTTLLPILNSPVSGGATADGVIFEKLRSKVVEAFLALLPEETINKLLEDEIKAFFELISILKKIKQIGRAHV